MNNTEEWDYHSRIIPPHIWEMIANRVCSLAQGNYSQSNYLSMWLAIWKLDLHSWSEYN